MHEVKGMYIIYVFVDFFVNLYLGGFHRNLSSVSYISILVSSIMVKCNYFIIKIKLSKLLPLNMYNVPS